MKDGPKSSLRPFLHRALQFFLSRIILILNYCNFYYNFYFIPVQSVNVIVLNFIWG